MMKPAMIFMTVFLSPAAIAATCPNQVRLLQATRALESTALAADTLWDQLADDSDASDEAEELFRDSRRLRQRVQDQDECTRIKSQFQEVDEQMDVLEAAIAREPGLARNVQVRRNIQQLDARIAQIRNILF